jgi:hypothetical protein
MRIAPAEVAFSPSCRITPRQLVDAATASVNCSSVQVRFIEEGLAIPAL